MEQTRYQVRFDWTAAGAHAIGGDADVIVWVDAIKEVDAKLDVSALPAGPAVVLADLPSAHAVAKWLIEYQVTVGKRILIAIVAAGASRENSWRFAAEDLLAAGAIIDQLAALGLDATSPEAATAEAAYRGLASATAHLMTAVTSAAAHEPGPETLRVNPALEPSDVRVVRTQV